MAKGSVKSEVKAACGTLRTDDGTSNPDMREKNALKALKDILGLKGIRPFFDTLKNALYGNYFSA